MLCHTDLEIKQISDKPSRIDDYNHNMAINCHSAAIEQIVTLALWRIRPAT
jgi:hypothetical protein